MGEKKKFGQRLLTKFTIARLLCFGLGGGSLARPSRLRVPKQAPGVVIPEFMPLTASA